MKIGKLLFWAVILFAACDTPENNSDTDVTGDDHEDFNLTVNYDQTVSEIQPTMYGVFFEDINFAIDGGLYAELVKNRSFEFDRPLRGWKVLKDEGLGVRTLPMNTGNARNARFMRIQIDSQGSGAGLMNEGFRGMGIKEGLSYEFSIMARKAGGDVTGLRIELIDSKGNQIGEGSVSGFTDTWQTFETTFKANKTEGRATMNIWFEGEGSLDIDMVSLFPGDTWKGRKKGLRADLVQLLADMNPGFLRFPGGCIVEGFDLSQRYQWKNTVGDIDERVTTINRWNFEFQHRYTPDYYQSFGVGFYEYFLLAEDLGAEPMPIINCGMACQFNTGELVPLSELGTYIQDALDLIEFANGPVTTKWGKLRADMGHPEPFNMRMLGVGNEQWGPQYIERYVPIVDAVKEKYPEIQIIAATGSDGSIFPNGEEEIEYLWKEWRRLRPEIVDEHFYRNPVWFRENADWYDDYQRDGTKLFVGEYASQSVGVASPENKNNWETALSEAAFMTGLERNADLVTMTSYAPLFAHAEGWQWTPDLIWFNNLESYVTPNYEVQKLYSTNPGTHLLKILDGDQPLTGQRGLYASAVKDTTSNELIIKLVNTSDKTINVQLNVTGGKIGSQGKKIELNGSGFEAENSFENPDNIKARSQEIDLDPDNITLAVTAKSMDVVRLNVN